MGRTPVLFELIIDEKPSKINRFQAYGGRNAHTIPNLILAVHVGSATTVTVTPLSSMAVICSSTQSQSVMTA